MRTRVNKLFKPDRPECFCVSKNVSKDRGFNNQIKDYSCPPTHSIRFFAFSQKLIITPRLHARLRRARQGDRDGVNICYYPKSSLRYMSVQAFQRDVYVTDDLFFVKLRKGRSIA